MEDKILFLKVQQDDRGAFRELFNAYCSELCAYAFQYVKENDAAKDIVQDFFVKVWQKRHQITIHTSFKAYAYKAVYFSSLNHLRDHKKETFEELLPHVNTSSHSFDPFEKEYHLQLNKALHEAIDALPEQCKKIFLLVCIHEMKYAEAARATGLSVNTIKVQMSKAYRILREKLNNLPSG